METAETKNNGEGMGKTQFAYKIFLADEKIIKIIYAMKLTRLFY